MTSTHGADTHGAAQNDVPARVIHGDALEVVQKLGYFDFVMTDPPYPLNASNAWGASGIQEAREMIDGMSQSFVGGVLRGIRRNPDFAIWLFCDWRQVSFYSAVLSRMGVVKQQCLVWDKVHLGLGTPYANRFELILFGYTGEPPEGAIQHNIIAAKRLSKSAKHHYFDKPVELLTECLRPYASREGGKLIDPFCGGGSSLIAGKRMGFEVTGIDISSEYCKRAEARLHEVLI